MCIFFSLLPRNCMNQIVWKSCVSIFFFEKLGDKLGGHTFVKELCGKIVLRNCVENLGIKIVCKHFGEQLGATIGCKKAVEKLVDKIVWTIV